MSVNCIKAFIPYTKTHMQTTLNLVQFDDVTSIPRIDITQTTIHSEYVRVRNNKGEVFFIGRIWDDMILKFHATTEHAYLLTADEMLKKAEKFWWVQVIDNEEVDVEDNYTEVVSIEVEQEADVKDLLTRALAIVFADKPAHLKAINKFINENA